MRILPWQPVKVEIHFYAITRVTVSPGLWLSGGVGCWSCSQNAERHFFTAYLGDCRHWATPCKTKLVCSHSDNPITNVLARRFPGDFFPDKIAIADDDTSQGRKGPLFHRYVHHSNLRSIQWVLAIGGRPRRTSLSRVEGVEAKK